MSIKIRFYWLFFAITLFLPFSVFSQTQTIEENFESEDFMFVVDNASKSNNEGWGRVKEGKVQATDGYLINYPNAYDGSYMMYVAGMNPDYTFTGTPQYPNNLDTYLFSKEFNKSSEFFQSAENVKITYRYYSNEGGTPNSNDNMEVLLYNESTDTWTDVNLNLEGNTNGWVLKEEDLTGKIRESVFRIVFRFYSNGKTTFDAVDEGAYIDAFRLEYTPTIEPTTLQSPSNGKVYYEGVTAPDLYWLMLQNWVDYRLQVSTTDSFNETDLVFNQTVSAPANHYTFSKTHFSEGKYYWRVKPFDGIIEGEWTNDRYFDVVKEQLSAKTDQLTFNPTNPKKKTVTVNANTNWSIVQKSDWLSVSRISSTLEIAVGDYTNTTERKGAIRLATNSGQTEEYIYVTQEGLKLSIDHKTVNLDANPNSNNYPKVKITSNTSWKLSNPDSDFAIVMSNDLSQEIFSGQGDKTVRIVASDNTGEERIEYISFKDEEEHLSTIKLKVVQEAGTPDPPSVPNLSSPDDGATGISRTPTLKWSSVSGADEYEVQVDTDPGVNSPFIDEPESNDSYSIEAGELDYNTIYYWQVRARNDGGPSEWSDIWEFNTKEKPEAEITIPSTPLSFGDQQVNTSSSPQSYTLSGSNLSEDIEVSVPSDFEVAKSQSGSYQSTPLTISASDVESGQELFVKFTPSSAGEYSDNITHNSSQVSEKKLQVEGNGVVQPTISVTSPSQGVSWQSGTSHDIQWSTQNVSGQVDIELHNSSGKVKTLFSATDNDGSEIWSIDSNRFEGTDYVIKIFATDDRSVMATSGTFEITNKTLLSKPMLASPDDGLSGLPLTPILEWKEVSNATSYEVQLATDNSFASSSILVDESEVDTSHVVASGKLDYETSYYWQVRARNDEGSSEWSETRVFVTELGGRPPAPNLVSPADGSTNISLSPTLKWESVQGAGIYLVEVSSESDFETLVVDESTSENSISISEGSLDYQTTYYWQIASIGDGSPSDFSESWEFTTQSADVILPVVTIDNGPTDGSIIDFNDPGFTWSGNDSDGSVSGYEVDLQGPSSTGFSTTDTFYQFSELADGSYTFRVRAVDNDGNYSSWAERSFAVDINNPPDPEITVATIPASITLGESITVETTVQNNGGNAISGGITLSFPDMMGSNDKQYIRSNSATSTENYLEVDNGETINTRTGQTTANYLMVEGSESSWSGNETLTLSVDVTPQQPGTFRIYIRSAMQGEDNNWYNEPSSGSVTDQQEWPVKSYTVTVKDRPISVEYSKGWNLVSIPIDVSGQTLEDFYSSSIEAGPHEFDKQYQQASSVSNLKGYWIKLDSEETVEFDGDKLQELTISLQKGWNLIGTISEELDVSSDIQDTGNIIENSVVWMSSSNNTNGTFELVETNKMMPGHGYFIKAIKSGEITLSTQ